MNSSEINNLIAKLAVVRAINGYTWNDIADQVNEQFGTTLSGDACRKRASYAVFIEDTEEVPAEDQTEETIELDPNIALLNQMRDERTQVNAIFRRLSREDNLIKLAESAALTIAAKAPLINFKQKPIIKAKNLNEALLVISDWHYGIEINNYMNNYSTEICKQRVQELTANVIKKILENKITTLHILNLGDMIAGIIHLQLRINSQIDVLSQIIEVSEIIAEMLNELSKYVNIQYYQVLDNHSRIDPNKKEALQLESLARITPWYLKTRFKDTDIITINDNEIDDDIASFYINNEFLVIGVHGDDDKKSNIIPKLSLFIKDQIDLICSAHLHHFSMDEDNRTVLISNGSLMGTDEYAFNKRLDSKPSQTLVTFKQTDFGSEIDGIYKLDSNISS